MRSRDIKEVQKGVRSRACADDGATLHCSGGVPPAAKHAARDPLGRPGEGIRPGQAAAEAKTDPGRRHCPALRPPSRPRRRGGPQLRASAPSGPTRGAQRRTMAPAGVGFRFSCGLAGPDTFPWSAQRVPRRMFCGWRDTSATVEGCAVVRTRPTSHAFLHLFYISASHLTS